MIDRLDEGDVSGGDERERRIAALVGDCSDRLNRGEPVDVRKIAAGHPDLAPDLEAALEAVSDLLLAPADAAGAEDGMARRRFGDFEIVREIGRGGMGVVYEAIQVSVERRVALKVLPPALGASGARGLRFAREGKAAGRLSHPCIVPVFAMGVEAGTPYFAMELVEGETLDSVLARRRRGEAPSPGAPRLAAASEIDLAYCLDAARAFAGVAEALHHAHAQGVVHRDLKPSNLILDPGGRLRILDFGLARIEGDASLTRSGEMLGTPLYMSPEQARGEGSPVDHRADIHALGATLYETLTGEAPFRGRDYGDVMHRVVHRDPLPARRIRPRIPQDLETLVMKCLEKDPKDRYATAEALAQDLARVVRGDPIEARPRTRLERAARFARRHAVGIVIAGSFAVLGGALAFLAIDSRAADARRREAEYEPRVREAIMLVQLGRQSFGPRSAAAVGLDLTPHIAAGYLPSTGTRRAGLVEQAVDLLGAAARDLPERPDAYYHRAEALHLLGREDEALADADRALAAAPDFVPARMLRATLLESAGRERERAAEIDRALADAAGVEWARAWLRAVRALRERRWADAAGDLSLCVEAAERQGEPYVGFAVETRLGRGVARLASGDPEGAVEDFVWAGAKWPDSLAPELLLGKAYFLSEGQRRRADRLFEKLAADPARASEVTSFVTTLCYHYADHERGLSWAERIADEAFRERARCVFLADMGRLEEAVAAGERAVALAPDDPIGHVNAGYAYFRAGVGGSGPDFARLERAFGHVVKAIELDPKNPYALTAYGVALGERTKFGLQPESESALLREKAIRSLRAALAIDPCIDTARWALAELLERAGDLAGAEAEYRETVALNPFNVDASERLGALLARRGERAGALAAYAAAVAADPARAVRVCAAIEEILAAAAPADGLPLAALVTALGDAMKAPGLDPAATAALARTLRAAAR